MVQVQFPDGSVKQYAEETTPLEIAEQISPRLAKATLAALVNDQLVDATRPLKELAQGEELIRLKLLTDRDSEALPVLRHSAAHIMARAVMRLFPNVRLAFGPTTVHGFYYDFDLDCSISEDDFPRIEEEMRRIISMAEPFERLELPREKALELCRELNQPLKVEHIETSLADHDTLTFYRQGEFVDLCRGPHIPDAGRIKAFKLLSVAAAHWKGEASGKSLQRLYGTAWFSKKELEAYLQQVEEAKKRDHRVLGKRFQLFHISQAVGQGLPLWCPKGAVVRGVLEEFIRQELKKRGYQFVYTPHLGRVEMYQTSGHFPYYRESQFPPLYLHEAGQLVDVWIQRLEADELTAEQERALYEAAKVLGAELTGYNPTAPKAERLAALERWEQQQERYLVKPMNCPHHVQIYKSQPRSYRDLPVRLAEFGTVYRYEQSGELAGLLRVRGLTQDDAHIFCTPEQVEQEFRETLKLVQFVLESVGLKDYRIQLSLRDPTSDKYVGSEEVWQQAEQALQKVLSDFGWEFEAIEGEAAFYGPKADFMVSDCLGREWQLGTVQLDYNLPERFELEYIGTDNKPHRPVMIHRAPFGSLERFVGVLIEHFAGAFPLWLAPEQVRVLPVSDKFLEYAHEVERQFADAGFRVSVDTRSAKINAKIRDAQLEMIPYMLIVGAREAEQKTVSVRDRIDGDLGVMTVAETLEKLRQEVEERRVRQVATSGLAVLEQRGGRFEY